MRTLQEKYNGIQEGKFSKDHFLVEARMQHPNLVTRFNGYDDAVQILKNRGMIQEAIKEDYSKILELPDGNYFAIDGDWEDNYQGNSGLFFTIQGINIYDKNGKTIQSSPREFLSQFTPEEIVKVESIEEEVDTRDLKNVKLKNGKIYRNVRFHLPNDPKSFVTSDGGYMINQDIANVVHADQEIKEEVGQNKLLDQLDNLTPAQILKLVGFLGKDALKAFVGKLETMVPKDLKEWSPYGSMAFTGEREQEKEKAPLSSLEVGDLVYVKGVSGDYVVVKDKKEDGTVGVGHPHNDIISYQDGNKEAEVIKRASLKEVTPAQEKYRVKPPTQFKQDIAAAKKMIDAGKSEKEVVAKYGQAAVNAVNAQNLGEARLTNKSLTDYRYKPTNDMDKYPYEQILRGLRVELEGLNILGTPTPEEYTKALGKVLKNLEKDTIYYTNQIAGVSKKVDLHDKMVDVKKDNAVDKFNGLKKAELKEGIKNIIKKILSENTKKASNLSLRPGDVLINKFSGSKYTVINVEGDSVYTENEAGEEVEINSLRNYELTESSEELSDFQDYYDEEEEDIYEMYGDSDGDYEYDKEVGAEAEMLYDKGKRFATAGEPVKGEALRQAAIKKGSWLGWGVEDFPPYEEADDISHPLGYEDQDEIDYDDENFSDPFIDGDLDEQKSEKELRAEWEKHQATSHPEDKMSYMEWRSEQGLEDEELFESVSLKDIL